MDTDVELDELTTVKLQLPKRQRLWLHSMKIMTGATMSEIAQQALEQSMEEHGDVVD